MENRRKKITTTLPQELLHQLKVQAAKENRKISAIFEELVTAYLEKAENS